MNNCRLNLKGTQRLLHALLKHARPIELLEIRFNCLNAIKIASLSDLVTHKPPNLHEKAFAAIVKALHGRICHDMGAMFCYVHGCTHLEGCPAQVTEH